LAGIEQGGDVLATDRNGQLYLVSHQPPARAEDIATDLVLPGQVYYCFYTVPGKKSVPAKVLVFLAKTFAITDLFAGTGLLAYGSQNQ